MTFVRSEDDVDEDQTDMSNGIAVINITISALFVIWYVHGC